MAQKVIKIFVVLLALGSVGYLISAFITNPPQTHGDKILSGVCVVIVAMTCLVAALIVREAD